MRKAIEIDAQQRAARRELSELRERFDQLTDVERAVFFGIVRNKLNKQLAAELGACERTIKAQRARMMEKLQISSLPELVRAARLLEGPNVEGSQGARGAGSCATRIRKARRHAHRPIPQREADAVRLHWFGVRRIGAFVNSPMRRADSAASQSQ